MESRNRIQVLEFCVYVHLDITDTVCCVPRYGSHTFCILYLFPALRATCNNFRIIRSHFLRVVLRESSKQEEFPGEGIKQLRDRGIATAFLEKNPRVNIFIFHRLNGTIGGKLNSSPGNRARRQISFPVSRAYPIRFVSAITTVSSFLYGDVARGIRGNEGYATRLENDSILAIDGATR